jgi:hypothetical protein
MISKFLIRSTISDNIGLAKKKDKDMSVEQNRIVDKSFHYHQSNGKRHRHFLYEIQTLSS